MKTKPIVMDDIPPHIASNSSRFMDQVRLLIRFQQKSWSTEKTYTYWIKRYILFHKKQHPESLDEKHIEEFLTWLGVTERASPSTQATALNALVFLYRQFFKREIGELNFQRARTKRRIPVVFSNAEAQKIIRLMSGDCALMAKLMYGSGLRVSECLRLRIKDIDFEMKQIVVREGKGKKDRITVLPSSLKKDLKTQIDFVASVHQKDLDDGFGEVYLPYLLGKKYPKAAFSFEWQFLFPASSRARDPRDQNLKRHHRHQRYIQKAVKEAINTAKIYKHASCHTFRHSFATRLLESGYDIRTIQELLGQVLSNIK